MRILGALCSQGVTNEDCNNLLNGIYVGNGKTSKHYPSDSLDTWIILACGAAPTYIIQFCAPYTGVNLYMRLKWGDSWIGWQTIK